MVKLFSAAFVAQYVAAPGSAMKPQLQTGPALSSF
jgi:hypothetical protein